MLTKRDRAEMRRLTVRLAEGSVTREDWSNLAALILLQHGEETVHEIAARGLDEFIRISKPVYDGHAFQYDDYCRMYDRICASVGHAKVRVH